jgi:hypothetical protein
MARASCRQAQDPHGQWRGWQAENGVSVIPVLDPRQHCDAISKTSVLLQFVAIDRRQLRLVR